MEASNRKFKITTDNNEVFFITPKRQSYTDVFLGNKKEIILTNTDLFSECIGWKNNDILQTDCNVFINKQHIRKYELIYGE